MTAVSYDEPGSSFAYSAPMGNYDPVACDSGACASPTMVEQACDDRVPYIWGGAEYLLWWTQGMATPPLVTTSPAGTPRDQAGVLGRSGTSILLGDSGLASDARSGGRFSLGFWLDACRSEGFEFSYLMLGSETETYSASSNDFGILGRPFYNSGEGRQDARLISFPNLVSGRIDVTASTELQGAEMLFRKSISRDCWSDVDLFLGYRWAQLDDTLFARESTLALSGIASGTTFDLFDRFETVNDFHGAEVGMALRRQVGPCWSVELLGKLALGNINSVATVDGRTITTTANGSASTRDGGLLTQPTNIGRYERDAFATLSELGIVLRRQFHCGLEASIGYTFFHLSEVARAGEQIDFDINVSQLPPGPLVGAERPEFSFNTSGFWAQGLSFGLEYAF